MKCSNLVQAPCDIKWLIEKQPISVKYVRKLFGNIFYRVYMVRLSIQFSASLEHILFAAICEGECIPV